jgi:hypothetical protein
MAKDLAYFQSFTRELIERDAELRKLQFKYEAISQLNYTLPEPLDILPWVVPYKSSVPYVALKGGTRALSSLDERVNIHPITVQNVASDDTSINAEQIANNWETTLKWEMKRATARQPNYRQSVIWNALVYDELVGTCIHLPTQIKSLKALDRDTRRHEAALRHGFFALKLYDPKQVHHYFSDYMLECVALVTVMKAQQIVDFWGKQAEEIGEKIKDDPVHAMQDYTLADVHTLDHRVVWAQEGGDETYIGHGVEGVAGGIEILPVMENKDPFIPWAIKVGGTNTESKVEHRRKPLLYPVVMAEQWFIANVVGTLGLSQAISESNAPLHEIHGAGGRNVRIDHTEPGGIIYTQQHQIYTKLQRGDIDPAIQGFLEKFEADMNRSTLPAVLVTSEAMPGESYSGYNLRVQTAIGALIPYKTLGEQFYDEQFRLMLLHTHYSGEDMVGYGKSDDDVLQKYIIRSEDIDPNVIVLATELSPDVPVDRVQKINSAIQMAERLNYSPIKILEYLGEPDPYGALQEWISWQFVNAKVAGRVQKIAAIESGQLQQMAMEMAQEMIMQQQAAAEAQQGANGGGGGQRALPGFGGERSGMEPNNPALGGGAPIQTMGDEATFEGATGESRGLGGGV